MQITMKKSMLMLLFTICLTIACGVTFGSFLSNANATIKKEDFKYKYFTSIQIEEGDSLWSIAEEYMSDEYDSVNYFIEEVKAMNALSNDQIHAGQYLIVPYYSNTIIK